MLPSPEQSDSCGVSVLQPSDKEVTSRSVTSLATDVPASSEQNGALTNGDSKSCKNWLSTQNSSPKKV